MRAIFKDPVKTSHTFCSVGCYSSSKNYRYILLYNHVMFNMWEQKINSFFQSNKTRINFSKSLLIRYRQFWKYIKKIYIIMFKFLIKVFFYFKHKIIFFISITFINHYGAFFEIRNALFQFKHVWHKKNYLFL